MKLKSKSKAYSDDVLERLKGAWYEHKKKTGMTQAQAAEQLGMNQSAFSQYLRGGICLNTDFISRFAQLVERPPAYFHQRLDYGGDEWFSQDATIFTAEVSQCLSNGPMKPKYVVMPRMTTVNGYMTVEIDNYNTRYKKGTVAFFSPLGEICESAEVGVFNDGIILAIGDLERIEGQWFVATLMNGIPTKIAVEDHFRLLRLEGTIQPEVTVGKRRFRHSRV